MNRKRVILGVLLGVLAVCLVYAYLATPRLEKAPPRAAGQRKQPVNEKSPGMDEKEPRGRIDFAYLTSEQQEFTGAQRDIFRFDQRHLVKIAPPPPVVQKEVSKPVVMFEAVPVEVVQKSLSQFTFLGFLEKAGEKTVFLSSGGNLFLVKQGERFGVSQEFLVVQIDNKLLKVRHAGREGLIEIELIEKQKLSAAPAARQGGQGFQGDQGDSNSWPVTKPRGLRKMFNPNASQEQENPGNENATEGEVDGKNQ